MHLGAQEVTTRQILQQFWVQHSVSATNSFFLAGYVVALRASFVGPIPVAMQQMIDYLFAPAGVYAQEVTQLNLMDKYLFDIPLLSICITENIVPDSTCVLATYQMIGRLSR